MTTGTDTHSGLNRLTPISKDLRQDQLTQLGQLFPQVVTETRDETGQLKTAIDFDRLRDLLSDHIAPEGERYDFNWVGKRSAQAEANRPSSQTLRPDLAESVNFEETKNLFITGDNLEVLKLLQESYLGKVNMIYIDPPYNTGNDFVYSDRFVMDMAELEEGMDLRDEEGRLREGLRPNARAAARYHSDWLSMIYPRLILARKLLKDSGVIFISIDDNEQANLKKLCDDVFGEENFVADVIWSNKEGDGSSDSKYFRIKHEYLIVYAKNILDLSIEGVAVEDVERYRLSDEYESVRGKHQLIKLDSASIQYSQSLDYPIKAPDGTDIFAGKGLIKSCWRWSEEKLKWGVENGYVVIKRDREGDWAVYTKQYLNADNEGNIVSRTLQPLAIIDKFSTTQSNKRIKKLFDGKAIFKYSKPVDYISYLLKLSTNNDSLILDFFAGSGTTADAVMQLNAEDGGKRRYILCTLDEETADKSAARQAGYASIDQIARERIRRAAAKIREEKPEQAHQLDLGFKALTLDSSNYRNLMKTPGDYQQLDLLDSVDRIKSDRSDLDLLFDSLLRLGLDLTLPIETQEVDGSTIYRVGEDRELPDLVACFSLELTQAVIDQLVTPESQPERVLLRDDAFVQSADKVNLIQAIQTINKDISIEVI